MYQKRLDSYQELVKLYRKVIIHEGKADNQFVIQVNEDKIT